MIFDPVQVKLAADLSARCDSYLEELSKETVSELSDAPTFRDWLTKTAPSDLPRWKRLCRAMGNNPSGKDTNQNLPLVELLASDIAAELCENKTIPDEEKLLNAVDRLARKHCQLLVVYQADCRLQRHPGNRVSDLSSLWKLLQYNQKTTGVLRPCISVQSPFTKICNDCKKHADIKSNSKNKRSFLDIKKSSLLLRPNETSYRRTLLDACIEVLYRTGTPREGLPKELFLRLNSQGEANSVTGAAVAWQTLNSVPASGGWLRQFHLTWRGVVPFRASLSTVMADYGRPIPTDSSAESMAENNPETATEGLLQEPLFEYALLHELNPAAWYVRQNPSLTAEQIPSELLEQDDLGFLFPFYAEAMLSMPGLDKMKLDPQTAKLLVWNGLPALKKAFDDSDLAEYPYASLEDFLFFLCRCARTETEVVLFREASADALPLEKLVEESALRDLFRNFLDYCSKQKDYAFPLYKSKTRFQALWKQFRAQPEDVSGKN